MKYPSINEKENKERRQEKKERQNNREKLFLLIQDISSLYLLAPIVTKNEFL